MQSRYIGSDQGLQMINQAGQQINESTVAAGAKAKDAVGRYLDTSVQLNERILKLEEQRAIAEAQPKPDNNAIGQLANAGLQFLANQRQQQQKEALMAKEAADKEAAERKKQQQSAAALEAESQLNDLTRQYLGGEFGKLGVETYKREAADLIAKAAPNLGVDEARKLMAFVNEQALTQDKNNHRKFVDAQEKLVAAEADKVKWQLFIDFSMPLKTIKGLGNTEQAKPYLEQIQQKLDQFLAQPSNLPEEKKIAIAAEVAKMAFEAYDFKAENYAEYTGKMRNFQAFAEGYAKAQSQYAIDGDLNKFKASETALVAAYGDFTKNVAQIGEAEAKELEFATLTQRMEQIKRDAANLAGTKVELGQDSARAIAVAAYSDPFFRARLKSGSLSKNPDVIAGLELADRIQKYQEDRAKLGIDAASMGVQLQRLELTRIESVNSILNLYREKREKGQSNQMLESLVQQLQSATNVDPLLSFWIQAQLAGDKAALKTIDEKVVAQQLNNLAEPLSRIGNLLIEEQQRKEAKLQSDYADLRAAGLFGTEEQIRKLYPQAKEQLNQRLQQAEEFIRTQAESAVTPRYGVQPNFNSSSVYAPDIDESGRVRVAPRVSLQTLPLADGRTIVTPVAKGARAPLTSGYGAPRDGGRRKHAGIDFGLEGDERAVTLVGGTAYVFTANGYGNVVDVVGDNGYVYRFAHQQPLVKNGQRVRAGDIISRSDGSGVNIGGNHLHFEVRKKWSLEGNGRYQPSYGFDGTVDPIAHLTQLGANSSNVLQPRQGLMQVARTNPGMRAPANAYVAPNGAAIQANLVQFPNGIPRQTQAVYSPQRPLRQTGVPYQRGNQISYDYGANYGYAELQNNKQWRKAIVDAAKELKVPPVWLADIFRQESGFKTGFHPGGNNVGLLGFDAKAHPQAVGASFEQQVRMAVKYFKDTGWDKVLQKKGGSATIADLWILARAGTTRLKSLGNKTMREYIIDGGDPYSMRMNDLGTTFGYELELLGKWAGRRYDIRSRRDRNRAQATEVSPHCPSCQKLASAGAWVDHQHLA